MQFSKNFPFIQPEGNNNHKDTQVSVNTKSSTEYSNAGISNGNTNRSLIHSRQMQEQGSNSKLIPQPTNLDYSQPGYQDASEMGGDTNAFKICLDKLFSGLVRVAQNRADILDERKEEINAQTAKFEAEIQIHNERIKQIEENDLKTIRAQREEEEDALRAIKENPEDHLDREKEPFKLWAYGITTAFLALFLFLFYSNVMYSLLYRQISTNKEYISHSIFAVDHFAAAYDLGFSALLVVIAGPALFFLLGLIVERQKQSSEKGKINYSYWAALVVTFLCDGLLAYLIARKVYIAEATISFKVIETYTLANALTDSTFWSVIMLGFLSYIVASTGFSMFLEERNLKLKLQRLIDAKEDKIAQYKQKEESLHAEIEALKREINSLKMQIAKLNTPEDKIFFSPHEMKQILSSFALGWIKFMHSANAHPAEIKSLNSILENFYTEKGLSNAKA